MTTSILVGLGLACFVVVAAWGLIYVVPQGLRLWQTHRWRRVQNVIALTYDDGPDPETTVELLDLLRSAGVKATFYLVGFRAEQCPEVIGQIMEDGHEIGAHSYSHWNALRIMPWSDVRDAERGYDVLTRLTRRPLPYRPPFGKITLPTLVHMLRKDRRVEWWNVAANDTDDTFPEVGQAASMLSNSGPVVLLHSHHPEVHRKEYMLAVTQKLIEQGRLSDKRFVTMSELSELSELANGHG